MIADGLTVLLSRVELPGFDGVKAGRQEQRLANCTGSGPGLGEFHFAELVHNEFDRDRGTGFDGSNEPAKPSVVGTEKLRWRDTGVGLSVNVRRRR